MRVVCKARSQFVVGTPQQLQVRGGHRERCQLVVVAFHLGEIGVVAQVEHGKLVVGAAQCFQLGEVFNAVEVGDVLVSNIYLGAVVNLALRDKRAVFVVHETAEIGIGEISGIHHHGKLLVDDDVAFVDDVAAAVADALFR